MTSVDQKTLKYPSTNLSFMQDFSCSMSMIAVTYSTNPIQNNTPKLDFPHLEATATVACLPILCLLCRLVKILVPA
jgi:hypothetical protein